MVTCALRTANNSCSFSGLLLSIPGTQSIKITASRQNFLQLLWSFRTTSGMGQSTYSNWVSILGLWYRLYGNSYSICWMAVKIRPIKRSTTSILGNLHQCQQHLWKGILNNYVHSTIMQIDWLQLGHKQWVGWWKPTLCPIGAPRWAIHPLIILPTTIFLVLITEPFFLLIKWNILPSLFFKSISSHYFFQAHLLDF